MTRVFDFSRVFWRTTKNYNKQTVLVILLLLAVSFLINSFDIYAQYRGVAPDGSEDILWSPMILIIPLILAAILAVISLPLLIFRKTRRYAAFIFLGACIYLCSFAACVRIGSSVRMNAFKKLAVRSTPLVIAIREYEKAYGIPPEKLEALVPKFIQAIPKTGMGAYPTYEYEVFLEPRLTLVWYDLGRRKSRKFCGLWKYPDGDSRYAIAVFTINHQNTVVEADVDRMPVECEYIPFNKDIWRQKKWRIEMVRSLSHDRTLKGTSLGDLLALLGTPDGQRNLRDSHWELRVNCPSGGINWDVFFFWPSQNYPDHIYGGSVERLGEWAYVHE